MKRYQITVDGRTFDVQVLGDPRHDRVEVAVDGEVLAVDVHREQDSAAAALLTPAEPRPAPVPAARPAPLPTAVPAAPPGPTAPGGKSVRAPLPGVVKRVIVKPGQQVAPGETLLVIEAMKMDNAIRAMRAGVIEAVHVIEGRQVAHGDELLRFT